MKQKQKPRKIFATSCQFCQVRYNIKKQTRAKNVS